MTRLGTIKILNPRDVWKNEEYDFTPWLLENADGISEVIGLPIEIEQREKPVGGYKLDLYGKIQGTNKTVVIENQLEQSDHRHLGQLITYAAGLNASVIIWVTPDVRDEHQAAIEWLNELSDNDTSFFLIRPEVIQIDDSLPAVKFHLVAGPSDFVRTIREAVQSEDAPRHNFRREFWTEMFSYLYECGHKWAKGRRTTKDSWVSTSVGKSGLAVIVSMAMGSRIRIEISMSHSSTEQNTKWFNISLQNKHNIESLLINEEVSWEPLESKKTSRIAVYLPYQKEQFQTDSTYRKEIFGWINKNLTILRTIAQEYLINEKTTL